MRPLHSASGLLRVKYDLSGTGRKYMDGWIKLHNKFLEWEWFDTPEMVKVWIYILITANWKEKNWRGLIIKRGQTVIGRKKLAERLRLSEQIIRTCIARLKSTNEITVKSTNKYSIITVVKWEEYQCRSKKSTNRKLKLQPTTNQQLTTPKDIKDIKTNIHASSSTSVTKNKMYHPEPDEPILPSITEDGEYISGGPEEKRSGVGKQMKELLRWAEERRGKKFVNVIKQYKAMKNMRKASVSPKDIKERWIELEDNDFFRGKGFDFMTVANSFDKKPNE